MALQDTGSWLSSRALSERVSSARASGSAAPVTALGRWWPALLVLALAWVAWLNAPSACALEESAWRDADAHLTRLMIRAHRSPASARPVALSSSAALAGTRPLEQQTLALQAADAGEELIRAKRELESSLGELRMCRQAGHGSRLPSAFWPRAF